MLELEHFFCWPITGTASNDLNQRGRAFVSVHYDDEEYEQLDQQARASALNSFKWALANGKDVDACIASARERELEAAVNERFDTARWWLVTADMLSELQANRDQLLFDATVAIEWRDGPTLDT